MTREETVKQVARKTGLEESTVRKVFSETLNTISESLEYGEKVTFRGFGTFDLQHRAQKKARDISKERPVIISDHYRPIFRPSKELKTKVFLKNSN